MPVHDPDIGFRQAAFHQLKQFVSLHGPVLAWNVINQGFIHDGQRHHFANRPRGIFRPAGMRGAALSIKTNVPRAGREARYDDQIAGAEGHFVYKFQGTKAGNRDNRLLLDAYQLQAPLIYFYGVDPGLYRPLWPVFITGWDPARLQCFVSVDEDDVGSETEQEIASIRRRYKTIEAKKRLHQDAFRAVVLRAYDRRCSICNLPRAELLEAAHILSDKDKRGRPEVPNGLALCRLHHGAYDRNLLGIRPDHVIEISPTLMTASDGPVLEKGIKAFNKQRIRVPRRMVEHPRADYLEERFETFLESIRSTG